MLAVIIEDAENNIYSELHLKDINNKLNLSGFSIENQKLKEFNKDYLNIFNSFVMSENKERVVSIDGYDTYLDKDTGFYHFFKNAKEDFEKFYYFNSKPALMSIGENSKKENIRKFKINKLSMIIGGLQIAYILFASSYLFIEINREDYKLFYNNQYVEVSENDILGTISYEYEENEYRVKNGITSDDIKTLIFSSENLEEAEKEYLWNQELIEMVVPYYQDNYMEVLIRLRHSGIDIVDFTEEEKREKENLSGFYSYDNLLHIKDYSLEKLQGNDNIRECVGHEDIHLLQSDTAFILIKEASAEIMSHEFFMNSSDTSIPFSYEKACRYLKVLMEIIGPEAVIDNNFRPNSTAIQDSVRFYLSDGEFEEFIYIMNLSPLHDIEELNNGKYERLFELLSLMYENKFNMSIKDNNLINTIMINRNYNRPYFSKSLIDKNDSYYMGIEKVEMTLEEALLERYVTILYDRSKENFKVISRSGGTYDKNTGMCSVYVYKKIYVPSINELDENLSTKLS